jgi:membrane-bound lytic murein transglycosylase D
MSAVDLRGPVARVDTWDSLAESPQDQRIETSRLRWLGTLMVAPLLAVPVLWTEQDPAARSATLEAVWAEAPSVPAIPLEVNPRVERWMHAFQTTRKDEFELLMTRRERFSEMIRSKLRARGLPEELIYIPMIESGLSPFAVSRVSAVGLWQFMSPTALQYGLRVDEYVDERRDPVRATDAALDYLEWLHGRFGGSWYLAAAAFNAGPGRVERILNLHAEGRVGDEQLYWEVLEYLPRETREYVPKMIAVTLLANDADALGFDPGEVEPYRYANVFVPGGTTLRQIASVLGVDPSELRSLNPHLIRGVTPPGEIFGVRVPNGRESEVVRALAEAQMRRADD